MLNFNSYLVILEKVLGVLGALIYLVFSLVVVKQVGTMTKNVKDKFNGILVSFSYLHLLAAIILVFLAWTIL